jgi:hypothetical protein
MGQYWQAAARDHIVELQYGTILASCSKGPYSFGSVSKDFTLSPDQINGASFQNNAAQKTALRRMFKILFRKREK